jgi:hypothetical protein
MISGVLGQARKSRGLFEDDGWTESLGKAKLPVAVWDERFVYSIFNISEQPLENTTAFLTEDYRLLQVGLPNEMVGWVFFRIEPDDENCTLLWIEVRRVKRVG